LGREAHGGQDVGGFAVRRAARRGGGDRDAEQVEIEREDIPLQSLEPDVRGVRDPGRAPSVDEGPRDPAEDLRLERGAQFRKVCRVRFEPLRRELAGFAEARRWPRRFPCPVAAHAPGGRHRRWVKPRPPGARRGRPCLAGRGSCVPRRRAGPRRGPSRPQGSCRPPVPRPCGGGCPARATSERSPRRAGWCRPRCWRA